MLLDYLQGYSARVRPLLELSDEMETVTTDFNLKWDSGQFPGWPVRNQFFFTDFVCLGEF